MTSLKSTKQNVFSLSYFVYHTFSFPLSLSLSRTHTFCFCPFFFGMFYQKQWLSKYIIFQFIRRSNEKKKLLKNVSKWHEN